MNAVDAAYLAACVFTFAIGAWLTRRDMRKRGDDLDTANDELRERLGLAHGQLAAANREIAMMRKARSDASRKGAVTKRAKRIQLPGVGV